MIDRAFFSALFDGCEGVLEARALPIPPGATTFLALNDLTGLEAFAAQHTRTCVGVYFGVATRQDTRSGARRNLRHLPAFFAEIDFKTIPRAGAERALEECPLRPTALVESGGGLHCYWALREPLDLTTDADPKPELRALARVLGADLSAAEPTRILRVPGSWNRKLQYGQARRVRVLTLDLSVRYNRSDFDWLLVEAEETRQAREPFDLKGEPIAAGARNTTLFLLGRSLKARGVPGSAIAVALRVTNAELCRPPLEPAELETLVHNVLTLPDSGGFRLDDENPAATTPPEDETIPLAERAPAFLQRTASVQRRGMLVPNLVDGDGVTGTHGQPRVKKDWLHLDLALGLATATPVLGLEALTPPHPATVWYCTDEDPAVEVRDRLKALAQGRGLDVPENLVLTVEKGVNLDEATWQAKLLDEARRLRPALTIISPLRSVSSAVDQGSKELRPLTRYLRFFMRETGSALLLSHHDTKPLVGRPDDRARPQRASGGGFFSIVDAPVHVEALDEARTLVVPSYWKFSATPPPVIFTFEADHPQRPTCVRLVGELTTPENAGTISLDMRVLGYLKTHGPLSANALAKGIALRKETVLDALHRLERAELVDCQGSGPKTRWFARGTV